MTTNTVNVIATIGLNVRVMLNKLHFKTKNQKPSYKLIVESPILLKEIETFGYLNWVDSEARYIGKSLILISSKELLLFHISP